MQIHVKVNRITEKAYLVEVKTVIGNDTKVIEEWMPKSQVKETDCLAEGDSGTMQITKWIAKEKGFIDEDGNEVTTVPQSGDDVSFADFETEVITNLDEQKRKAIKELKNSYDPDLRLEVHVGLDPDSLPRNQGDMQISAYLTDEGLVVDVFHGDSDEAIASGYEFFSEAGLNAPTEIEKEDNDEWDEFDE